MEEELVIHVVLASDQNYFVGLLVTACSIARFVAKDAHVVLHILDGGLNAESVKEVKERVRAINANVEFDVIAINGERFAACPIYHGSRMTYARILLPELLPQADFVIYSDVDVLWMTDIAELWKTRSVAHPIQAVRDKSEFWAPLSGDPQHETEAAIWQKNDRHFDWSRYVNAGVLIMNLEFLRKDDFQGKSFRFLAENQQVPFVDQTVLNFLYDGMIGFLPEKWNMQTNQIVLDQFGEGVALHYAGYYQPWRARGFRWMFGDDLLIWHKVNARINDIPLTRSIRISCGLAEYIFRRILFHIYSAPVIGPVVISLIDRLGASNHQWVITYYTRYNKRLMNLLPVDFFEGWRP